MVTKLCKVIIFLDKCNIGFNWLKLNKYETNVIQSDLYGATLAYAF